MASVPWLVQEWVQWVSKIKSENDWNYSKTKEWHLKYNTCTNMYVCMYVCAYIRVCMYVCMYGCMYVCMYVHKYVHTYVHTFVRTYVCMYVCVCTYVCTYVRMYVCMYVPLAVNSCFGHDAIKRIKSPRKHETVPWMKRRVKLKYLADSWNLYPKINRISTLPPP